MGEVAVTRMFSKGQIVVPKSLREELGLDIGELFAMFGDEDTIILKRIDMPSKKDFDEILAWGERYSKDKEITRKDLEKAISETRTEAE